VNATIKGFTVAATVKSLGGSSRTLHVAGTSTDCALNSIS